MEKNKQRNSARKIRSDVRALEVGHKLRQHSEKCTRRDNHTGQDYVGRFKRRMLE